ncbi:MAG: hypothetical protein AAGD05_17540, partial [Bacteroidota bacterium]
NISDNNYEYIKAFDDWLKDLMTKFSLIYSIWIPLLFIGFVLAILQTNLFVPFLGTTLMEKFVEESNTFLVFGLPILWIVGILLSAILLSYCSIFLFKKEMNSIYGDLISKLDSLLNDLNELK